MQSIYLPITALLAGVALLLLGSGLLNTTLVLLGDAQGFSATVLGALTAGYFVGFLLGIWLIVPLIQRIGHIRAFAFCAALAAACALFHVLFPQPWTWFLLRVAYGIAIVALYTIVESWLNARTPGEHRGRVFALYMAVNLGALALGQQLIRLTFADDNLLFVLAAVLLLLALMPVAATRLGQPEPVHAPRVRLWPLWEAAPLAVVGAGLSGLAMGAFWGLAPLFAGLSGLDRDGIGIFMSLAIVGGAAFQWPIGSFSDRFDRRRVLGFATGLAAFTAIVMSQLPPGNLLLLTAFLWGGLAFAVYPIAVAHLIDHLAPEEILTGSGGLLLIHGGGAAVGPLLAGYLISLLGGMALPLYLAASQGLLALLIVLAVSRSKAREPQPAHFTPILRTSAVAMEMASTASMDEDPDADEEDTRAAAQNPS